MLNSEELPDYIFRELLPVSKLYQDEKSLNKINTLHICLDDSGMVSKGTISSFINKVKGIIRHDECCYLEVEGPIWLPPEKSVRIIITTKYDDPYDHLLTEPE